MRSYDLVPLAIGQLPSAIQGDANEILYRSAAGWKTVEIGSALGLTWRAVNGIKAQVADATVNVLRSEGIPDAEIIRTLRVPTSAVVGDETRLNGP